MALALSASRVRPALLLALRNPSDPALPRGPGWLREMARDFTALGGFGVLTLLTAAAIGYLLMLRKRHAALLVLIAVAAGSFSASLSRPGSTGRGWTWCRTARSSTQRAFRADTR